MMKFQEALAVFSAGLRLIVWLPLYLDLGRRDEVQCKRNDSEQVG